MEDVLTVDQIASRFAKGNIHIFIKDEFPPGLCTIHIRPGLSISTSYGSYSSIANRKVSKIGMTYGNELALEIEKEAN